MITNTYLKNQITMLTIKNTELTQENEELKSEVANSMIDLEHFNCHVEREFDFWHWTDFNKFVEIQELKEELKEYEDRIKEMDESLEKKVTMKLEAYKKNLISV